MVVVTTRWSERKSAKTDFVKPQLQVDSNVSLTTTNIPGWPCIVYSVYMPLKHFNGGLKRTKLKAMTQRVWEEERGNWRWNSFLLYRIGPGPCQSQRHISICYSGIFSKTIMKHIQTQLYTLYMKQNAKGNSDCGCFFDKLHQLHLCSLV